MDDAQSVKINDENLWRLETPGADGWERTARADDPQKYFMVSTDCHANEPPDLWATRLPTEYRERAPRIITDDDGVQWRYCEGYRPDRVRVMSFEGEDWVRSKAGADPLDRLADNKRDGIDVEIIFPNKGLAMWATPDPVFANAQCKVWNDWAWEQFGPHKDAMVPVASIATGDLEGTLAEIERTAKMGYRVLSFPCKPMWGGHDVDHVNYN
ncbi:MAG: amidohydrolase family protein, partial [Alphaproteobacteria bacterium]